MDVGVAGTAALAELNENGFDEAVDCLDFEVFDDEHEAQSKNEEQERELRYQVYLPII